MIRYVRRTLNCGHLDLVEAGLGDDIETVGSLAACYVCPKRDDYPPRRGKVATMRQVVKVEYVQLAHEPDAWDTRWWFT